MANRVVIKSSQDTYYDDEEPTIPSVPVPNLAKVPPRILFTPIQLLALGGLASAALVAVGGIFDSMTIIGFSGIFMLLGNIQAMVRK